MRHGFALFIIATVLSAAAGSPLRADPLPALGADAARLTVSGLSSGAYMAGQFQVAYSQSVIGAALVAGGPYGCARTPGTEFNPFWAVVETLNLNRAQNSCMEDGWWFWSTVPSAALLLTHAETLVKAGRIDPLSALAADKTYLFSSSADETVERGVVEAADRFYREAGLGEANLKFEKNDRAAHAFLIEGNEPPCGTEGPPFLNGCGEDQAKAILDWLIGPLQPAATPADQNFVRFDQEPYAGTLSDAYLAPEGVAYVPPGCRSQRACAVHVVFHGCKQNLAAIGDRFVKGTGYARWAEGNRIILLFPQTAANAPNGCWDWWGYTGPKFLEREAPQMLAVKRMVERLAAAP
jgi:hypothetical protein